MIDDAQLALIHPTGDRDQHESEGSMGFSIGPPIIAKPVWSANTPSALSSSEWNEFRAVRTDRYGTLRRPWQANT